MPKCKRCYNKHKRERAWYNNPKLKGANIPEEYQPPQPEPGQRVVYVVYQGDNPVSIHESTKDIMETYGISKSHCNRIMGAEFHYYVDTVLKDYQRTGLLIQRVVV